MKVYTSKTVVIQIGNLKPQRFTDAAKAAECWARVKEDEWIEKNKNKLQYQSTNRRIPNILYGDARIRYRKFKRRSQAVFRRIMEVNS